MLGDDVQAVPIGKTGLSATTEAVVAGPAIPTIMRPGANLELSRILDTVACRNGPPDCDDMVNATRTAILAGANGIAETNAVDSPPNIALSLNSAWRNPERNEAVNGVLMSRHQFGNAVDLTLLAIPAGKTRAQTFCILEAVGDELAQGIAERRSDPTRAEMFQADGPPERYLEVHPLPAQAAPGGHEGVIERARPGTDRSP